MISQILGSARLILQLLLVVAVVVLIYWWNPMNVFGGKAELKPTGNMVSEIREIGEMITAEYYGEVLTSIEEVQIDLQNEPQVILQAETTYEKIFDEINNLKDFQALTTEEQMEIGDPDRQLKRRERKKLITDKVGRSNILEKLIYLGDWEQTSRMPFFDEILTFIYLKQYEKVDVITDPLRENRLRKTLEEWYDSNTEILWDNESFKSDYYASKLSDRPRSEARKKLAMIGRGTVKAGFDFEGLQSHMYYLNEEVGELHIFGLAPEILNADINPWFIPEKGIPGFDLLTYNGKVDFKDSRKVKIYAIQKLKTNARKAGIIEQAELNGGQTISRLINLLTNVEVKKVIFHHDEIIDLTKDIQEDRYISFEEASLFEQSLNTELNKIDSLKEATEDRYNNRKLAETKWNTMIQMIKQLQTCEFESQQTPYHYFATLWYRIAEDGLFDGHEWATIKNAHQFSQDKKIAELWTNKDTLLLKSQLNQAIFQILKDSLLIGNFNPDTLSLKDWNARNSNAIVKDISIISEDSTVAFYQFEENEYRKDSLLYLIGLEKYQPNEWEDWVTSKESIRKITVSDTMQHLDSGSSKFWMMDKSKPDQLIEFNIPLEKLTYPLLLGLNNTNKSTSNLEIGNHIIFKSLRNFSTDILQPNQSKELSVYQKLNLEIYLTQLHTQHSTYHNRDFLTKANQWFTGKMESKSGILDKFK